MGDESDLYFSCAEEGMLEARSRNNDTLQIPGGADADPEGFCLGECGRNYDRNALSRLAFALYREGGGLRGNVWTKRKFRIRVDGDDDDDDDEDDGLLRVVRMDG